MKSNASTRQKKKSVAFMKKYGYCCVSTVYTFSSDGAAWPQGWARETYNYNVQTKLSTWYRMKCILDSVGAWSASVAGGYEYYICP